MENNEPKFEIGDWVETTPESLLSGRENGVMFYKIGMVVGYDYNTETGEMDYNKPLVKEYDFKYGHFSRNVCVWTVTKLQKRTPFKPIN